MNKIQFEKLLKPLVNIYDEIELDLIRNVLDRLTTYKSAQGSLEWYLEKLADLGTLDRNNLKVIKNSNKKIEKVLKEIATKSGTHIEDLDTLQSYFDKGLINVNPNELFESVAINNLIDEALNDTEDIMRLINTKAIESTKKAYMKILNKAYIETASGIKTYTASIREGIKEFAKEGIKGATYESGKTISIEAVVRRDVITRMNKLTGDAELKHAKDLETNLVYVDQHLGARIRTKYMKHDYEAHAEWQGKKYMLEGSSEEYPNFYKTTGYGEMLGLKGINCYHNMRPTWEWEKVEPRIDEMVNAEQYELFQKQRAFERKIRELKRRKVASKDIDSEEYTKVNHKLKKTNEQFDKWLKDNNLTRDYNREFVEVKEENYIDITDKWIDKNIELREIEKLNIGDKFSYKGIEYVYDGKQIKYDFNEKELKFIDFLKTKKNNIIMNPSINYPEGISTADLTIDAELFDMKITSGKSTQLLYHNVRGKENQANNFLFETTKSILTLEELEKQIDIIFKRKDTYFVKTIGIKKDEIFKIYKRK